MQLAIVAAGFTPGEADRLRRSMAAWKRKGGLQIFEQRLVDGMEARGYEGAFARQIYQQILGFGEYGFPESHSASFALLVYVSSWLKHYEPAAFCGALLNAQPMGFYAPAQLVGDARRHGVDVRPPDVTISDWDCTLEPAGSSAGGADGEAGDSSPKPALRLGLRLVGGLTEAGAESSLRETRAHSRTCPTSRIARQLARDLAALAGCRCARVARRTSSRSGMGCRGHRANAGAARRHRVRRSAPALPALRRARTSSPTTGASGSRCAGIHSHCCAVSCASDGVRLPPKSSARRTDGSCARPASSSAASARTRRAVSCS